MSWTDDRVALLSKLWKEGKTAKEIAETLGDGVTRNAVIGKAHRLNLSGRVSPIQQPTNSSTSSRSKAEKAQTSQNKKAPAKQKKQPQIPQPANKNVAQSKPKTKPEGGVALSDLKDSMCRWPEGDPKEEGFHFCGGASVPGFPYCEDHVRAAYQTNKKAKILTPEALEGSSRKDDDEDEEQIA